MRTTLPIDSAERKLVPIYSGFMAYFPAAIAGAAKVSQVAMKQHNLPKLGHNRGKSADHADCVPRHMMDVADAMAAFERGEISFQQARDFALAEASSAVWRVCAWSQELHERFGSPMAPAAYLPPVPPPPPAEEKAVNEVPDFLRTQRGA
jgi:hypothetical protein